MRRVDPMFQMIIAIFTLLFSTQQPVNAMRKPDVLPGTLVQLRYKDQSIRKQINLEVMDRAILLHNTPSVVMERPFWYNDKRARIQSVYNTNVTLAVKWKDLLMLQKPMNKLSRDGYSRTLKLHIFDGTDYLSYSDEFQQRELRIANDNRFDAVFMENEIDAPFLFNKPLRLAAAHDKLVNSKVLDLWDALDIPLYSLQMDWFELMNLTEVNSSDRAQVMSRLKSSLKQCLARVIWAITASVHHNSFLEGLAESELIDPNTKRFCDIMRIAYRSQTRSGAKQDLDWLREDMMSQLLVAQMMSYIHEFFLNNLKPILRHHFKWWLGNPEKQAFHPVVRALVKKSKSIMEEDPNQTVQPVEDVNQFLSELQIMMRKQTKKIDWVTEVDDCLRIGQLFHIINKWGLLWKEDASEYSAIAIVRSHLQVMDKQNWIRIMERFAEKCNRHKDILVEVSPL